MEQKEFQLKDHILIIDNFLEIKTCINFINYLNLKDKQGAFADAKIIGDTQKKPEERQLVVKKIRNCANLPLTNTTTSKTDQHWCNFFINSFRKIIKTYCDKHPLLHVQDIIDMQILKYGEGGHYINHVDDHPEVSRSLSIIYRLNNDFEGGDLVWSMHGEEFLRLKPKPNSLVVWPSNFLYPHRVEPIKKGLRWSVVAWAR